MTQALEKNQQKSMDNELYKQSSYYKGLIKRSLRYLSLGYPIHFTGVSGIGKTTLALHIAKQRKQPVMLINGNKDLSNRDLIGAFTGYKSNKVKDNYIRTVYKTEENVTESWIDGRLLEAIKNGYTLIYDEFTRSKPETNNIFLPILEERILPLYGTKRKDSSVKVHPDFSVIFTSNPAEYVGVYQSQDALLDRMITLPLDQMDEESEIKAVMSKTHISEDDAVTIVGLVSRARDLCSDKQVGSGPGLRASIMIAEISRRYKIPIKGSNQDFWDLCFDIIWFPLQACSDKVDDRLINKLKTEFKKIK